VPSQKSKLSALTPDRISCDDFAEGDRAVRTSPEVGRRVNARLLRVRRRNIPHIELGIERQGTVLRVWLVDRADGVSELHYEGSELVDLEIAVVGPQNT